MHADYRADQLINKNVDSLNGGIHIIILLESQPSEVLAYQSHNILVCLGHKMDRGHPIRVPMKFSICSRTAI